jgi:hypothetical protein
MVLQFTSSSWCCSTSIALGLFLLLLRFRASLFNSFGMVFDVVLCDDTPICAQRISKTIRKKKKNPKGHARDVSFSPRNIADEKMWRRVTGMFKRLVGRLARSGQQTCPSFSRVRPSSDPHPPSLLQHFHPSFH